MRHFFIMRKAQECYKSARPESCNRTCKISRGPLPYVSLSPWLRIITMSLCPWKCVGCSWLQHGFESIASAPESCSEHTWGDELCCQHGQVWVIPVLVQKPWIQEPISQAKICEFECFGLDECFWFSFTFLFYYYCFTEIETILKYQIKQVP